MAAPTLAKMREGLAENLRAIDGVQVSAYMLSNPTTPAIHVFPDHVDFDEAMGRGLDRWRFTVQAFVGLVSEIGAQLKLDELLGPSGARSVKAAVEADRTLGGVVDDLQVTEASGYRVYSSGLVGSTGAVLGCEWTIEVMARGA